MSIDGTVGGVGVASREGQPESLSDIRSQSRWISVAHWVHNIMLLEKITDCLALLLLVGISGWAAFLRGKLGESFPRVGRLVL